MNSTFAFVSQNNIPASSARLPKASSPSPHFSRSTAAFAGNAIAIAAVLALSALSSGHAHAQSTIASGGGNGSLAAIDEGQGGAGGLAGGGGGGAGGYSTQPRDGRGGDGGSGAQPGTPAQRGADGQNSVNSTGTGAAGGPAGSSDLSAGGGGGGGGALGTANGNPGGAGGTGSVSNAGSSTLGGDVTGTAGGNSQFGPGYGGGGGGGGGGLVLTAPGATIDTAGRTVSGGAGGTSLVDGAGGGGAGLVLVDGGSITNGTGHISGGAGGIGYAGGQGGTAVFLYRGGTLANGTTGVLTGGNGGSGGTTNFPPDTGRGGIGGDAVRSNGGQITNAGTAQGGSGGVATIAGNGGNGIVASGTATVTNTTTGQILGGAGGAISGAESGSTAGRGGNGVVLLDAGATIVNNGTVAGGNAGNAQGGAGSSGGVGVAGSAAGGNTVINSGRISGGLDSNAVRANAVDLRGSGNTLELHSGGAFDGNVVVAPGGTGNQLVLGGNATTDSFNVGSLGTAYQGFDGFRKSGSSVWTLSGTQAGVTPWTVDGGVLALTDNANLGSAAGKLTLNDGTLRLAADGLHIANAVTLGSGQPVVDTGAFTGTLAGAVDGSGLLTKTGTGTLVLTGNNTYTGTTSVGQGTLRAGAANRLSAASAHSVAAGATLDTGGFNQTVASLTNSGTVSLLSTAPGSTLTVKGAYVGNGGVLRLGTALGGNGSATDRLLLDGGSASGSTTVQVTNLGGLGAQTTGNGIEVVAARNGATSTATAFTLANGHVDAGAYAYTLHGADQSWYLRSDTGAVTPGTPGVPGATPVVPSVATPTYRTEVPLFAALPQQLRKADLGMMGNLHQRIGDEPVGGTAARDGARNAWGRVISTDIDVRQQGTVSPASKGRVEGFQVGTDLFANANWRAGVYVGQLNGDVQTSGFANGVWGNAGSNDLRSRYLGAYVTWVNGSGFYADAVLQGGDHRYTLRPQGNASVTGKGDSLLASIEVGQAFALGQGWTIEPQLQLIHQRVDLDDAFISGARVQQNADSGWIVRAGARIKGEYSTSMGALQPYGRINLYRATSGTDISRFVGPAGTTDIATRTGGSWGEAAAGATLAVSQTWSVYGEIGRLFAMGGDARVKSGLQGSLGVKARW